MTTEINTIAHRRRISMSTINSHQNESFISGEFKVWKQWQLSAIQLAAPMPTLHTVRSRFQFLGMFRNQNDCLRSHTSWMLCGCPNCITMFNKWSPPVYIHKRVANRCPWRHETYWHFRRITDESCISQIHQMLLSQIHLLSLGIFKHPCLVC